MDFQSILNYLSGPSKEQKYAYTDPEIQQQQDAVDKLKMSGVSQQIVEAQQQRLADMQSKRQQPVDQAAKADDLSFLNQPAPDLTANPDMSMKIADPNSVPSSYDVNVSDTTVPMNGQVGDLTPPPPSNQPPQMQPMNPIPPIIPPVAASTPASAKAAPASTPLSAKSPAELAAMGNDPASDDQAQRDALDKQEKKNKLMQLFPQLLAGAGDVITAAGAPMGTKATDALDKTMKIGKDAEEARKKDLEQSFLNDPKSGMSKVAQSAAARLLGKKPEDLAGMSLTQIDKAFPIWKEALNNEQAKELKQMQLEYLKASKSAAASQKQTESQDALEKQQRDRMDKITSNRSAGLGLQDGKVNQSLHLLQLMDQYKNPDGTYSIPPAQYEELAIGLANLVSGSTTATDSMIKGIKQKTAQGDLAGALTYVTGKNYSGSSTDIFKNLRDTLERQGTASEKMRDKYMKDFVDTAPKDLEPARLQRLASVERGNSVREYLKDNGGNAGTNAGTNAGGSQPVIMKDPKTGKRYQVDPTTKKVIKEIL